MRNKIFSLISWGILASMLLAACAPSAPTPVKIIQTVEVLETQIVDVTTMGVPASEDPQDVWNMGFYMQIPYNTGNDTRRLRAEIIKAGIEAVNPKFSVQVLAVPETVFSKSRDQGKLPVFSGGRGGSNPRPALLC